MRRTFCVRNLAWLLVISALFVSRSSAAVDARRPNIVFIFTDDHAYQAISAYGSKVIDTPNIDRLATTGVRFDRCLVTNSICGPARAVILTGKYSHLNGFYNNENGRFDGSQTTFPKLLQKAGYQTAIVGKWHLVSQPTGFDHWEIVPGQGQYYNPPMTRNGKQVKHDGYTTDVITDLSLDWLKKRDPAKPFLLMCQHKAPHREWSPNLKHLGHDGDRQYPEPATLFDDYAGRGKAAREQAMTFEKNFSPLDAKLRTPPELTPEQKKVWDAYYEPRNAKFREAKLEGKELVRWRFNRYMHDYLGCIKSVDENVGRVLDYLKEAGLEDNTIVVYASDQGFYLGEHGWYDKRWMYEESLRTPLLVRWPGVTKAGTVNNDIVSNVDFAQTLLDAAGVESPADMQGRSLRQVCAGETPSDWRKSFYYHYYEFPGPHDVRKHYGVATKRYKLIHFYEPEMNYWELFDLKSDPQEMTSVFGKAEYAEVQAELEKELAKLRAELKVPEKDPIEADTRARAPQPPRRRVNPNGPAASG
jgi:arylsulfatase A-like enzyme